MNFSLPLLDADYRSDLARAIMGMPASKSLGLNVVGFSKDGVSVIEMPVAPQWTFDGAVVQGGIVGVLADYAGVSAAAAQLPAGWIASTTSFEIHNIAPAKGEKLVAIGRTVTVGKSLCVSRADVFALTGSAAVLVAIGNTTCKPLDLNPRS
ncbi:MAG: PaaI family thioesterase [Burkholderiaceae bacterium]